METTEGDQMTDAYAYAYNNAKPMDELTLRDYFAAKAMQGMLSCEEPYYAKNNVKADTPNRYADLAYEFADAMLEARKK
jgi:hypothetical protein